MGQTVTFVIHGTFAATVEWWRLGADAGPSFADALESELSKRGLRDSVWKPALGAGMDYAAFAWSGNNRHRDRMRGGRSLARGLNDLAGRVGATEGEPLTANFVAHSHGGNVLLEALPRLAGNVRPGRIVLLGTPLIVARPAFRVARFAFATMLAAMMFLGILAGIFQLIMLFGADAATPAAGNLQSPTRGEWFEGWRLALLFPALVIAYAWAFWLIGNFLDVVWRVLMRAVEPLSWLRRRDPALPYGPSPRRLAGILRGQPILALQTRNDEADLLLQITCAPATLYSEYVRSSLGRLKRAGEALLLRPLVIGVFLKAAEMLLEIVSLGFPLHRALFLDFEVAPEGHHPYERAGLLVRQRLDVAAAAKAAAMPAAVAPVAPVAPAARDASDASREGGVHMSLREVTAEIARQVRLRHSAYYDNPDVIRKVSDFVAGATEESRVVAPAAERGLPRHFWERLVLANVALGLAVAAFARGLFDAETPALAMPLLIGFFGYMVPLVIRGGMVGMRMLRSGGRSRNVGGERALWLVWGAYALMMLAVPLGSGGSAATNGVSSASVVQSGSGETSGVSELASVHDGAFCRTYGAGLVNCMYETRAECEEFSTPCIPAPEALFCYRDRHPSERAICHLTLQACEERRAVYDTLGVGSGFVSGRVSGRCERVRRRTS